MLPLYWCDAGTILGHSMHPVHHGSISLLLLKVMCKSEFGLIICLCSKLLVLWGRGDKRSMNEGSLMYLCR